jgi:hypothetical protein
MPTVTSRDAAVPCGSLGSVAYQIGAVRIWLDRELATVIQDGDLLRYRARDAAQMYDIEHHSERGVTKLVDKRAGASPDLWPDADARSCESRLWNPMDSI